MVNSNNRVKPNFRLSKVVSWLSWGFDNYFSFILAS